MLVAETYLRELIAAVYFKIRRRASYTSMLHAMTTIRQWLRIASGNRGLWSMLIDLDLHHTLILYDPDLARIEAEGLGLPDSGPTSWAQQTRMNVPAYAISWLGSWALYENLATTDYWDHRSTSDLEAWRRSSQLWPFGREHRSDALSAGAALISRSLPLLQTTDPADVLQSLGFEKGTARNYRLALAAAESFVLRMLAPTHPLRTEDVKLSVDEITEFYRNETPPLWLDVERRSDDIERPTVLTAIPQRPAPKEELYVFLERALLGADLHVHVVGTGTSDFWLSHAERLGLTMAESDFRMADSDTGWAAFRRAFSNRDILKRDTRFIQDLILWNCRDAQRQGVLYLEMSAGAFLFSTPELWLAAKDAVNRGERDYGVIVRFLVGLNREDGPFLGAGFPGSFSSFSNLIDYNYFRHIAAEGDAVAMSILANSQTPKFDRLRREGVLTDPLLVGFDLCGFEPHHPPREMFDGALDLLAVSTHEREPLGFRIHAGEGVENSRCILDALELVKRFAPKARLGHGVGFARHLKHAEFAWSGSVIGELCEAFGTGVAVEVNLTSNKLLLGIPYRDHPLRLFLDHSWPVVVGTDDPGVFGNIDLRSEFVLAIENELIVSTEELKRLIQNSLDFAFLSDDLKAVLRAKVSASFGN